MWLPAFAARTARCGFPLPSAGEGVALPAFSPAGAQRVRGSIASDPLARWHKADTRQGRGPVPLRQRQPAFDARVYTFSRLDECPRRECLLSDAAQPESRLPHSFAARAFPAATCWASVAMDAPRRISVKAFWAAHQMTCPGHHPFREQDGPGFTHVFKCKVPSMISSTSNMDISEAGMASANPPPKPREEVTRPARARRWSNLDKKLSGTPVAWASAFCCILPPGSSVAS